MKITKTQIEAIYEVAVKIFADQVTHKAGIKVLQEQHQWNPNSARDYIKGHSLMMKGELFERTMNAPATDYFLSQIAKDLGPLALEKAVRAVREHIKHYERNRPRTLQALRLVAAKYEFSVSKPISLAEEEELFRVQVKLAFGATAEQRQAQLNASPRLPEKVARLVESFKRSPYVVAEVLHRAAGVCGSCLKAAPFARKKDGAPYLEVHHRRQLAHGGEDTVANAIAVCPNCHRELHYGGESA
jgi:5-methylcytosine-specific restriction protein A